MLLVAACGVETPVKQVTTGSVTRIEGLTINIGLSRFVDAEACVVCWVFVEGYGAGLSCLPLSETTLGVK